MTMLESSAGGNDTVARSDPPTVHVPWEVELRPSPQCLETWRCPIKGRAEDQGSVPRMVRKARQRPKLEGVASAERVLAVLTAFRRGDDALELTELARRTALVKSTIMRLCISLEKFDLVECLYDGRHRLGVEAARIGSVYQQSFAMEERIVPVLERLASESLETASFYIRRGNQRLCLFRVDSPYPLRMNVRPGDMRPMDRGSIAQVLF